MTNPSSVLSLLRQQIKHTQSLLEKLQMAERALAEQCVSGSGKQERNMSLKSRHKIAAAQRKRWARWRQNKKTAA